MYKVYLQRLIIVQLINYRVIRMHSTSILMLSMAAIEKSFTNITVNDV